jgi:hypothetical protein
MFSTVYRVTQKDFYARGNISVEVRQGTVLLEYETGICETAKLSNMSR